MQWFIVGLFVTVKNLKQPKCFLMGERLKCFTLIEPGNTTQQ